MPDQAAGFVRQQQGRMVVVQWVQHVLWLLAFRPENVVRRLGPCIDLFFGTSDVKPRISRRISLGSEKNGKLVSRFGCWDVERRAEMDRASSRIAGLEPNDIAVLVAGGMLSRQAASILRTCGSFALVEREKLES